MPHLKRFPVANHVDFLRKKKAVRCIKNDDLNWQRAIYVAQVCADIDGQRFLDAKTRHVEMCRAVYASAAQTRACERLKTACAPFDTVFEFLEKVAAWLGSHVAIYVWTSITQQPAYSFGSKTPGITLCLIHSKEGENADDDVLYVLTNPKAFNSKDYECVHCGLMYNTSHSCSRKQLVLQSNPVFRCESCRKPFSNAVVRDSHEEFCTREICDKCNCTYSTSVDREHDKHECGEFYCRSCKLVVDSDHLCCLEPLDLPTLAEQTEMLCEEASQNDVDISDRADAFPFDAHKIIVFDVETESSTGAHNAILICSKRSTDGVELQFSGPACVNEFCTWLFSETHQNFHVLAHNLSGFDGMFLMKYFESSFINPNVLTRGNKIMSLTVREWNITCLDFLLFCPMKLAKLPKALSLPDAEKTFFPHRFSSPTTLRYVGPLVDECYYSPNEMNRQDRAEFLRWYDCVKRAGEPFDYWRTLVDCKNDVDILLQAVLKYRKMFMSLSNGVDPFEYTTLPQACFATFQARHLPAETFGIFPVNGYESNKVQSTTARMWMAFETRHDGEHCRTKFDNGEERVLNYHVDGSTSKRFLEFYGVSLKEKIFFLLLFYFFKKL